MVDVLVEVELVDVLDDVDEVDVLVEVEKDVVVLVDWEVDVLEVLVD